MPKIIEDVRHKILMTAREQLLSKGYSGLAIRDVAGECSIATGTVYNYYPSKDMLAASVMLEDWTRALDRIRAAILSAGMVNEGLKAIYQGLAEFLDVYAHIWSGYMLTGTAREAFPKRHILLVGQLVSIIRMLLENHGAAQSEFVYEFIAESLLTAVGKNTAFDLLAEIFDRILLQKASK